MDKTTLLKIKKLMALAEGSSYPEESASALGKAQALMLKHKVDQAMLEDVTEEEGIEDFRDSPLNEEDKGKKKQSKWKARLASVLCEHNGCSNFSKGVNIILVGKPSDVATIRYMYGYCVRQINRLTKQNCKGQGRTYSNNFRYGCIEAIDEAMKAEQEALRDSLRANHSEKGLIVIDSLVKNHQQSSEFAQKEFKLVSSRTSYTSNDRARQAGEQAGSSIYRGKAGGGIGDAPKKLG